jgi:hypothetical protein
MYLCKTSHEFGLRIFASLYYRQRLKSWLMMQSPPVLKRCSTCDSPLDGFPVKKGESRRGKPQNRTFRYADWNISPRRRTLHYERRLQSPGYSYPELTLVTICAESRFDRSRLKFKSSILFPSQQTFATIARFNWVRLRFAPTKFAPVRLA